MRQTTVRERRAAAQRLAGAGSQGDPTPERPRPGVACLGLLPGERAKFEAAAREGLAAFVASHSERESRRVGREVSEAP
jgi:hypothetical protein